MCFDEFSWNLKTMSENHVLWYSVKFSIDFTGVWQMQIRINSNQIHAQTINQQINFSFQNQKPLHSLVFSRNVFNQKTVTVACNSSTEWITWMTKWKGFFVCFHCDFEWKTEKKVISGKIKWKSYNAMIIEMVLVSVIKNDVI